LALLGAGDLLRAEVESGGPQAAELQRIMKEGQLVSDDTMITLLKVRRDSGTDVQGSGLWQKQPHSQGRLLRGHALDLCDGRDAQGQPASS
jgi:adenylate kinase family enzyme